MDMQYIDVPLTVATSAYTANRVVGGAIKVTGGGRRLGVTLLRHLIVKEVGSQKAPLTLLFFDADPGVIADGATPSLSSLVATIVAKVNVAAADYETVGGVSIADIEITRIVRSLTGDVQQGQSGNSGNLWLLVVGTGTPTFGAANALSMALGLMRQ